MNEIRAVIFDADGPLYYRTDQVAEQKRLLLAKYGYEGKLEQFEAAYEKEKFAAYVRTETAAQMYQVILQTLGVKTSASVAATFTDEMEGILSQVTPTDHALATLKAVKQLGMQTCVLTDSFYSSEKKWPWFEKMRMKPFIDFMVSSFDIRHLKDSPQAYQACLDALKTTSDQTIFVGHQEYEMVGARKIGIRTIAVMPISTPGIKADYKIDSLQELPTFLGKIA